MPNTPENGNVIIVIIVIIIVIMMSIRVIITPENGDVIIVIVILIIIIILMPGFISHIKPHSQGKIIIMKS